MFAALQLSPISRNLAYSQLTTLLKGRLSEGFVPNMWMPNWISFDRSGPPMSAFALRALYDAHGDSWLVDLLYADCRAWIDWFWRRRRLAPLGMVALGSDAGAMASKYNAPSLRMAMLESGMDNSPMYDEASFDNASSSRLMRLYDVGMSSIVVAEMRHLAALARSPALGGAPSASKATGGGGGGGGGASERWRAEADELERRAAELTVLVQRHLWNEPLGIFTNLHAEPPPVGRLSGRVSPTSFYPMAARIATDRQATRMIREWLANPQRFCIDIGGVSEGERHSACHWGLPSIAHDDLAYRDQDYWRGLVWSPTALLVYVGLRNYDHLPLARTARAALVRQMRGMVLTQWRRHRHVCENYSPWHNASNCTGDRFHQWGALGSYLSLVEDGHVALPTLSPLETVRAQTEAEEQRERVRVRGGGGVASARGVAATGGSATRMNAEPASMSHEAAAALPSIRPAAVVPVAALRSAWGDWRGERSPGWWSWREYSWWPRARRHALAPLGQDSSPWGAWWWRGSGWWGWRWSWLRSKRSASDHSGGGVRDGSGGDARAPSGPSKAAPLSAVDRRAGYAQAAEAQARLEKEMEARLETWLNLVLRHLLGAFGSHGIEELDLDDRGAEAAEAGEL